MTLHYNFDFYLIGFIGLVYVNWPSIVAWARRRAPTSPPQGRRYARVTEFPVGEPKG